MVELSIANVPWSKRKEWSTLIPLKLARITGNACISEVEPNKATKEGMMTYLSVLDTSALVVEPSVIEVTMSASSGLLRIVRVN